MGGADAEQIKKAHRITLGQLLTFALPITTTSQALYDHVYNIACRLYSSNHMQPYQVRYPAAVASDQPRGSSQAAGRSGEAKQGTTSTETMLKCYLQGHGTNKPWR